jgi:MoxR-like ATPase
MDDKRFDLSTLESIGQALHDVGYIARRSDVLALCTALYADVEVAGGSKTIILEGEPGTGKSALAGAVAQITLSQFVPYQFHAWSDADELFVGVDVCAAVAGDAESVRQEGVLAKVARLSQESTVVLLLDEIDKAPERTEYLLLDWLQTGRVPIQPGLHLQTNLNNVMTFITSNNHRDLSEATKRRAARVMMNPLPVMKQEQLIRSKTGLDKGFVRLLWKLAREVAESEKNTALSIQEGIRLALSVWQHAENADDLKLLLSHWAARSQQGRTAIAQNKFDRTVNATWSELCRARS